MIDLDGAFYRGGFSVGRAEGFAKGLNKGVSALKDLGLSPEIIESFIKLCNADNDTATQD